MSHGAWWTLATVGALAVASATQGSFAKRVDNAGVAAAWKRGERADSLSMSTDGVDIFSYRTLIGFTTRHPTTGEVYKVAIRKPNRTSVTTSGKHMPAVRRVADRYVDREADADTEITIRGPRGMPRLSAAEISRPDEPSDEEHEWHQRGPWRRAWGYKGDDFGHQIVHDETRASKWMGPTRSRLNWHDRAIKQAARRNRKLAED